MRIRDLLFEDVLSDAAPEAGQPARPVYDKVPGEPAFIVSEDGTSILLVTGPPRAFVPMVEGLDVDAVTLALVKTAAEQGSTGIEWEGGFTPVQNYFNAQDLPFAVVLKHPDTPQLVLPHGVKAIEAAGIEPDRFYCLTTSERLGRRPTVPGLVAHGVRCPDTVGLFIFNPRGVLTVFLEHQQRRFTIHAQA